MRGYSLLPAVVVVVAAVAAAVDVVVPGVDKVNKNVSKKLFFLILQFDPRSLNSTYSFGQLFNVWSDQNVFVILVHFKKLVF